MSGSDRPGGRGPRVVVTGAGLVSPLGASLPALWDAAAAGRSGIADITGFDVAGLPCRRGGEITGFDPSVFLGRANFRPLDRTGRLATVAAALALEHAGRPRTPQGEGPGAASDGWPETGLVLGTMFGSVHTISAFDRRGLEAGPKYTKPLDFANSVINAAAGQAAIWHRLRGVNATLSGGTTAGLQALGYAADLVASQRADAVLAGGADELCYESFLGFVRGGWAAVPAETDGGASDDGASVPFHARRRGFVPAEGAALLLLEPETAARARGANILAEIRGHATVFDPSRGEDPERAAAALQRAVSLALGGAGVAPEEVACLSASASGSPAADRAEARGVASALGERATALPVMAIKGLLGEALGASGAFQVLVALGALAGGEAPGIPGLDETEDGFPLKSAGVRPRVLADGPALVTAVGLDGNVSALVIEAWDELRVGARRGRP